MAGKYIMTWQKKPLFSDLWKYIVEVVGLSKLQLLKFFNRFQLKNDSQQPLPCSPPLWHLPSLDPPQMLFCRCVTIKRSHAHARELREAMIPPKGAAVHPRKATT